MGDYLTLLHSEHKARKLRLKQAALKAMPVIEEVEMAVPDPATPEPPAVELPRRVIGGSNFDLILNEVCRYYDVRRLDVLSHRNVAEFVQCRHMVAYQLYNFTNLTNPQIGTKLNRDPTTIWYAILKVKNNIGKLKPQIDEIEKIISDLLAYRKAMTGI